MQQQAKSLKLGVLALAGRKAIPVVEKFAAPLARKSNYFHTQQDQLINEHWEPAICGVRVFDQDQK